MTLLALLPARSPGQSYSRGCTPGFTACEQQFELLDFFTGFRTVLALPVVCRSPSGVACCNGAAGCPSPCPLETGFHDSSSSLPSFEQNSHHCCTVEQRPCDDGLELANEVSANGLPASTRCISYAPPFLQNAETDAGPGCTFFCGDGFVDSLGFDRMIGTLDDEECDDANPVDTDGCSNFCKIKRGHRKVAVTGDAAGGGNVIGAAIYFLTTNDAGRSAALLDLNAGNRALVDYDQWSGVTGVVQAWDEVAGRPNHFYNTLSGPPNYTDAGVGVFDCEVSNLSVGDALCRAFSRFGVVTLRGDPAGSGTSFDSVRASAAIQPVAFVASLQIGAGGVTAANDTGLWLEPTAGASLQLLAREDAPAPGLTGPVFEDLAAVVPSLTLPSRLAFAASLRVGPGGVTAASDAVLYRGPPSALAVLAREGSAAPGTLGVFESFLPAPTAGPGLNGAGDVAFDALLLVGTGGVTAANRAGVWKTSGGPLQLVARAGSPAPDTPAGVVFQSFRHVILDDAGDVAFVATLSGPGVNAANNTGVWAGRTSVRMRARSGEPAPGAAGLVFAGFPSGPSLNAIGQLLIPTLLQVGPGGVTAASDAALFLTNSDGVLQLLVREADPLEIAPGDIATLGTLGGLGGGSGSGGSDGRPKVLNDRGEAAFVGTLTDGRAGAFLASVAGLCWDPDGDAICGDGDVSTVRGDAPCSGGATAGCDDNCPALANASQVNTDGDDYGDACDNCRFHATANLTDTDGDGRGDTCECTDQNGDGRNTVADLVAINLATFNPTLATPLCDGNNDGACNVIDIVAANVEIFSPTSTSTCARQPVPGP